MEDAHTPGGYFIAIVAVLGGALLMPPFPVFIVVVGPALLLGILAYGPIRARRNKARKDSVSPLHQDTREECPYYGRRPLPRCEVATVITSSMVGVPLAGTLERGRMSVSSLQSPQH